MNTPTKILRFNCPTCGGLGHVDISEEALAKWQPSHSCYRCGSREVKEAIIAEHNKIEYKCGECSLNMVAFFKEGEETHD